MSVTMRFLLGLALMLPLGLGLMAQPGETDSGTVSEWNFNEPREYELGGVEVRGVEYTDSMGIINISGLYAGAKIKIPGDDLARAIHKLWDTNLFVDVNIELSRRSGNLLYLVIVVKEYPRFSRKAYRGVKKNKHDDLNGVVERYLRKGRAATPAMKLNAINAIKSYYAEKGYLDAQVSITEQEDPVLKNSVMFVFDINRGQKVRIADIVFKGNEQVADKRLRRQMKGTKRYHPIFSIFKASKYIREEYEADKRRLETYYHNLGRRDMVIVRDSMYYVKDKKGRTSVKLEIDVEEGNEYYFGDIVFKGNTSYRSEVLHEILGIKAGDVYNEELLQSRLNFDRNGRDISTLYMDNGHLFFRSEPVEKGIRGDTVDVEIRVVEGPVATIGSVRIKGNTRTHEHVIRRELRTLPGEKFSRSDIIRSQREIMALNYFNPEAMDIQTPVNPQLGTVDIEYDLEERPADQLELSAGWGGFGRGLIGTLGVTFNNFSLRNMFNSEAWSPLPQGDGQRLSLRVQTNGRFFQSYNFSLTEPWLGGRKPTALSFSAFRTVMNNGLNPGSSSFSQLAITGLTLGLGTRLSVPDDYFFYQVALNYQLMDLYQRFDFEIPTGKFNNFSINQTISRNSVDNPMFPRRGSQISMTLKLTPPYSLLNRRNYGDMAPAERFRWVEYHKWDIDAEWYTPLSGGKEPRIVFKAAARMGFLGAYNQEVGLSPFERYELGGDGIANMMVIQGRDIISLRGYRDPIADVSEANRLGAALYNKFTAEVRALLSPNPSAQIYVLGFLQGGNAWSRMRDYNPFDLRRSAGVGLRVFLPMFGTLGFDYGIGFDKNLRGSRNPFDYGAFNIVLGFEPR